MGFSHQEETRFVEGYKVLIAKLFPQARNSYLIFFLAF